MSAADFICIGSDPAMTTRSAMTPGDEMRTIRWGMIGCGDVAEVKSRPAFYKAQHSQLVAVMPRNAALAAEFARRHDVPRSHDDSTLRCAAAGKPVIFFEGVGHALDILDFMLGPIADVQAFADNQAAVHPTEDVSSPAFASRPGLTALAHGVTRAIATRGTSRLSGRAARSAHVSEMPIGDPPHVQQPLIQSIVDELNGKGRCPSTGESALRTARVLDAIVRALPERS